MKEFARSVNGEWVDKRAEGLKRTLQKRKGQKGNRYPNKKFFVVRKHKCHPQTKPHFNLNTQKLVGKMCRQGYRKLYLKVTVDGEKEH